MAGKERKKERKRKEKEKKYEVQKALWGIKIYHTGRIYRG